MSINTKMGCLSIMATPIGNLEDISLRAIRILKECDYIAAEDTRHTRKLLSRIDVFDKKMISFHDYSNNKSVEKIMLLLLEGNHVVLVSDAGTPLISDPGYPLVIAAHEKEIKVQPIPGPCALIAALCVSGLPSDKFIFTGFLPSKSTLRKKEIKNIQESSLTWIFYETPHRIKFTIEECAEILQNDRKIVIAKEITKKFETFVTGTAKQLVEKLNQNSDLLKGEFVVIIEGNKNEPTIGVNERNVMKHLMSELSLKQSSVLGSKITGVAKRELYNYGLSLNL